MAEHIEMKFFMKNVFNPDESLSRWIIKLTMARNDLFYTYKHLISDDEIPFGENFYYFRMAFSHLREAIKLICLFSKEKEIIDFVKCLAPINQKIYNTIKGLNEEFKDPQSPIRNTLMPIRNNSFHYYEGDTTKVKKNPNFEKELITNLNSLADMWTSVDGDNGFSNKITFHLIFGVKPNQKTFEERIEFLAEILTEFISFADDSLKYFLSSKKSMMRKVITKR